MLFRSAGAAAALRSFAHAGRKRRLVVEGPFTETGDLREHVAEVFVEGQCGCGEVTVGECGECVDESPLEDDRFA